MQLSVIEQNGIRVLTTNQLAEAYGTDTKMINRNFQRNSERYEQGKHFFALSGEELREFKGSRQIDPNLKFTSILYLWTEKGAWLHAKSLSTDKAWDAYEMLVDDYYRMQQQIKPLSEKEQLMAAMKLTLDANKEIGEIKSEIVELRDKVENQITLDHGQQRRIQRLIGSKVYEVASNEEHKRLLFAELHREIKDRFGVASYKDLKRQEMLKAIAYIESWVPRKAVG